MTTVMQQPHQHRGESSSMPAIVASVVRRWADRGMDGQALNQWQAHALLNDTPEVDCLTDLCRVAIRRGVDPDLVAELLALTRRLFEWNAKEGGHWSALTGDLDQLASELHRAGHRSAWTVAEIGRTLRPALRTLREVDEGVIRHGLDDICHAQRTVDRVLREVSDDQLFTASVEHELKAPNYRLLRRMHGQREAVAA